MLRFSKSQGLGEPCGNGSDEGMEITEGAEGSTEHLLSGVEDDQYLELPEFLIISLSNLEPSVHAIRRLRGSPCNPSAKW